MDHQELEEGLSQLSAAMRWLDVNRDDLRILPADLDFANIPATGVLRTVADRLSETIDQVRTADERKVAEAALADLWTFISTQRTDRA